MGISKVTYFIQSQVASSILCKKQILKRKIMRYFSQLVNIFSHQKTQPNKWSPQYYPKQNCTILNS